MIKIKSDVKKTCATGLLSVAMVVIPYSSQAAYVYADTYAHAYWGAQVERSLESYSEAVSVTASSNFMGGESVSTAYAGFGVLKISGVNSGIAAGGNSRSTAYWTDQATISAQSNILDAFVTANILVRGKVVAGNDDLGGGNAHASFTLGGSGFGITGYSDVASRPDYAVHSQGYTITSGGTQVSSLEDMFRLYTFQIPIRLGTAFGFSIRLDGNADAFSGSDSDGPGYGFASYDLGHSLYWAGISELRDANGNLITDYSLSSESGVDYRNSLVPTSAVPVPASIWLFLSGMLAFGFTNKHYFDKNRHTYVA